MASAARKISARQRAPRRGARVQHILGESLECFAESGFERVTYDELIARSKVSRGSFYWYFPSKEALYEAVLDTCVTGYVARLEEQFAKTDAKDPIVKRLLDTSLADFNGSPSSIIEGTYRQDQMTVNTSRRHVIVASGPDKYLVSLAVTTDASQAVAEAPSTDGIINGFRAGPPGSNPPAAPPQAAAAPVAPAAPAAPPTVVAPPQALAH